MTPKREHVSATIDLSPVLGFLWNNCTLAIWRCPSISLPAALRQESQIREVGCACCKTPDQLFQRQQSAFESVSAAPDERATYVFQSDCAARKRHLFFRRVGYERRLTVSALNDTELINVECVRGLRAPTRGTRLATAADNHWAVVSLHSQSVPIVDHSVDLVSTTPAPRHTMHTHRKRRA